MTKILFALFSWIQVLIFCVIIVFVCVCIISFDIMDTIAFIISKLNLNSTHKYEYHNNNINNN